MERRTSEQQHEDARVDSSPELPILFFDGECVMCNGFVDVVLEAEGGEDVRFAPLQGETARKLLTNIPESENDWSIVYLDETGAHEASEAVLRLCLRLGGFWTLMGMFFVIPTTLRDGVYRWVARNRYSLFGRRDSCRVPTPDEEEHFLP